MPASGREKGNEEGRERRERATRQQGRKKGGLGEGGGFPEQLHTGARTVPAQRVACSHGQDICNIVPLSPCLLLTEWIEHSHIIKIS